MGRMWQRKGRPQWYCEIGTGADRKQYALGTDKTEAQRKYYELMYRHGKGELDSDPPAGSIISAFLSWFDEEVKSGKNRPGTLTIYRTYCNSFVEFIGDLKLSELKRHHVTQWVRQHKWNKNPNTENCAIRTVQRPFNWAVAEDLIDKNPIAHVKKQKPRPRQDVYLKSEQYQAILNAIRDDNFRDLVEVLRHTGCRPEEIRKLTADRIDRGERCLRFEADYTAKTRGERIIPLNDRAFALCCKWANKHPEGAIFRNRRGTPWKKKAIVDRCRRLSKKLGFRFVAYSLRHSYITDAVAAGVNPIQLASLVGHVDLKMIETVYNHPETQLNAARKTMDQATQKVSPFRVVG